jgi:hypothetical protein
MTKFHIKQLGRVWLSVAIFALAIGVITPQPANAEGFKFDFKGSLGEAGGHKRYVPPLVNPLFNETPYITTEARPLHMHYDLPSQFLTTGGTIDVTAVEIRVALTDRLGFIASKDGYVFADFDAVLPDDNGFANISLGLKYAVLSKPKEKAILTVGIEYEPPTGGVKTAGIDLQGGGDGFIDFFVTGAKAWDKFGLQGSIGYNHAIDGDHDSSMVHYSVHADYEVFPNFFPIIELNGVTTVDHGTRTVGNFEGFDLVNFGSTDSGTVVTLAAGARYRLNEHVQFGIGYEAPITNREDIINWKVLFDVVLTY